MRRSSSSNECEGSLARAETMTNVAGIFRPDFAFTSPDMRKEALCPLRRYGPHCSPRPIVGRLSSALA